MQLPRWFLDLCASSPIWTVMSVEFVRNVAVFIGDDVADTRAIAAYNFVMNNDYETAAILGVSAISAIIAYRLRATRPILAAFLFVPQQIMVCFAGFGTIELLATPQQGSPHSWEFLLAAQFPQFVMMLSHAAAVIYCVSPK